MRTSIRYKILKFIVGLMNTKKLFALPKDELLKKQRRSTKIELSASQTTIVAITVTGKFSGNIIA